MTSKESKVVEVGEGEEVAEVFQHNIDEGRRLEHCIPEQPNGMVLVFEKVM